MDMFRTNELSDLYLAEVLKPQIGTKKSSDGMKQERGQQTADASAKRIRQATYDIRYRARREDIPLEQAFNQYMGKSNLTGPEKNAIKEKLGLSKTGGSQGGDTQNEESVASKKYKVRVKDRESGKTYVRYATREKINSLRSNPNISSVEMTGYGKPYEGERKKGEQTAKATAGKGLDPVGREDKDIDNDGDHDKTDKYLLNRRKKIGKAIETRKEHFSWKEEYPELFQEVCASCGTGSYSQTGNIYVDKKQTDVEPVKQKSMTSDESKKEIKEKKIKNKIKVNPEMREEIENLGGVVLSISEEKDEREYDYEGDMAMSQLRSIIRNSQEIHDLLMEDTNIAEWVQSKITLATDYIQTVRDYMLSEMQEQTDNVSGEDVQDAEKMRKTRLQNMKKMLMKQQMIDKQRLNLQRAGKLPVGDQ